MSIAGAPFHRRARPQSAMFGELVVRVRMATDMRITGYFLEVMKRRESLPFR
jgi:hypothetical protein